MVGVIDEAWLKDVLLKRAGSYIASHIRHYFAKILQVDFKDIGLEAKLPLFNQKMWLHHANYE